MWPRTCNVHIHYIIINTHIYVYLVIVVCTAIEYVIWHVDTCWFRVKWRNFCVNSLIRNLITEIWVNWYPFHGAYTIWYIRRIRYHRRITWTASSKPTFGISLNVRSPTCSHTKEEIYCKCCALFGFIYLLSSTDRNKDRQQNSVCSKCKVLYNVRIVLKRMGKTRDTVE